MSDDNVKDLLKISNFFKNANLKESEGFSEKDYRELAGYLLCAAKDGHGVKAIFNAFDCMVKSSGWAGNTDYIAFMAIRIAAYAAPQNDILAQKIYSRYKVVNDETLSASFG